MATHLILQIVPGRRVRDQLRRRVRDQLGRNHLQPGRQILHQLVRGSGGQRQHWHALLPPLKLLQLQLSVWVSVCGDGAQCYSTKWVDSKSSSWCGAAATCA